MFFFYVKGDLTCVAALEWKGREKWKWRETGKGHYAG